MCTVFFCTPTFCLFFALETIADNGSCVYVVLYNQITIFFSQLFYASQEQIRVWGENKQKHIVVDFANETLLL